MPTDVYCGGDLGMFKTYIIDTQIKNIWLRPRFHVLTATGGAIMIVVR